MTHTASNPTWGRRLFRRFNQLMLFFWDVGLGPMLNCWPSGFGRFLVITTYGRKTGQPRRTPLNYAEVGGMLYCTAGFGGQSDWYRNLLAQPKAEVWLADGWYSVVAADVSDDQQRLPILRQVLQASGFVAPLLGLQPTSISDRQLAAATADYRLVQLQRVAARTGPGGPGKYQQIWPWLAQLLAVLVVILWRKRRS